MFRRPHLALLLVACLCIGAACSGSEQAGSGPATSIGPSPPVTDSPLAYPVSSDPSTPIYIAVGVRFGVALASQPAAGYRWQLAEAPDADVLLSLGSEFLVTSVDPEADQTQVFNFVGRAEGETSIDLVYVNADGSPVPEAEPASFSVTVNADGQPPPPPPDTTIALDE